jgi:hypothetical protein
MSTPNTTRTGVSHRIVNRHVGELLVDPKIQRAVQTARVAKMAADFDPNALGVLTTSYRQPGVIHIVDGQHRYRAAEMVEYKGEIITTEYSGLTAAEEAALFRKLNTTQKVSPIDQFLVACVEGREQAVRLAKVIADNGWTLHHAGGRTRLSAIRALERADNLDQIAAARALNVLTTAFGHEGAAVHGNLIEGLTKVLARYGDAVQLEDMAKKLAAFPGSAEGLLGHARGQAVIRNGNLSNGVARVIVGIYNNRRRTTALAEWQ